MRALIGHTGFVGGNLLEQNAFQAVFNSKNCDAMRGGRFADVVCAGISAVKWKANKEPEADRQAIAVLKDALREVEAERFVLISTIDVYPVLQDANEHTEIHGLDNHAYGRHRLEFEDFCRERFRNCYVVRLPGLFGPGLRKNVIYDLLHNNCLEMINPNSSFQYYDLRNLTADIERIIQNDIRLVNLFSEPVATSEILDRFFTGKKVGETAGPETHYNLETAYGALWGQNGPYQKSKKTVLTELQGFIRDAQKQAAVA